MVAPETPTIAELARRVRDLRDEERRDSAFVASMRAEFERSIEPGVARVKAAAAACAEAETELRTLALAEYERTGNKQPGPGVAIRVVTKLDYDPQEALAWAIKHLVALQLDRRVFESLAKTAAGPAFVVTISEPQATIASDLGKALGEDGVAS